MRTAQSRAARYVVKRYRLGQIVIDEGYRVLNVALMREDAVDFRILCQAVVNKLGCSYDKAERQKTYLEAILMRFFLRGAE